ncbi:MAG: divalent-cation tolerance protein CutA [Vicinamibacterales bacterium]
MTELVIVLTTVPDVDMGERLARTLVEERLAACVNVSAAMVSVYRWRGAVARDEERQLVIKTTRARVDALRRRVRELHSYELPEWLVCPVLDGSAEYLNWVRQETETPAHEPVTGP